MLNNGRRISVEHGPPGRLGRYIVLRCFANLDRLDFFGHDIGWAIGAAEKRVGFVIANDLLRGGIEF